MSDLKFSFIITKIPFNAVSFKNQQNTVEIQADDKCVRCSVWYDFHPNPLVLNGYAQVGDNITIILMKHRIEMYVNQNLVDEEWPNGSRLFTNGDNIESDFKIIVEPYFPSKQEQPKISSVFFNAEGWKPDENVFVGDCMPYVNGEEYHVLYLKDRHHHYSKWGMGAHQWAHISTRDFAEWRIHPMAVEITDPTEGSICTGSWIKHNETEFLFYTVRRGGNLPAPICRSVSIDGYHYEKDMGFGFVLPEKYNRAVARDPKVIKGEDGLFHMILTTSLVCENKGCLAHFISEDLETWLDTNLPIYISEDSTEPECPDYIFYNGRYYLIFSLNGKARYLISNQPFGDWKSPENHDIPCASVPKGAVWNDKIVFTGFKGIDGYAGTMTFKTAITNEIGELVFL
jgi:hypothetical protein